MGKRVLLHTRAQAALMVPSPQVTALRQVMAELFHKPAAVAHVVAMLQGTDDVHDLGPGERAGRWLPCCGVTLPGGRGALVDFTGAWSERARGYTGRVEVVRAKAQLPLDALLVRPDGLVAWAASPAAPAASPAAPAASPAAPAEGLDEALRRWFGPAGGRLNQRKRAMSAS